MKPDISALSASTSSSTSNHAPPPKLAYPNQPNHSTPTRPPMQQNSTKSLSSLPPHMLSEAQSFNSTTKSSDSPTDGKGKALAYQPLLLGLRHPSRRLNTPQRNLNTAIGSHFLFPHLLHLRFQFRPFQLRKSMMMMTHSTLTRTTVLSLLLRI